MEASTVILHSTPVYELKALISDAVSEQLKQFLTKEKETDNRLRNRKETAQILGVSLPTLHEWTKTGVIQGARIGSRVRYRMSDVEAALKNIQNVKCKRR